MGSLIFQMQNTMQWSLKQSDIIPDLMNQLGCNTNIQSSRDRHVGVTRVGSLISWVRFMFAIKFLTFVQPVLVKVAYNYEFIFMANRGNSGDYTVERFCRSWGRSIYVFYSYVLVLMYNYLHKDAFKVYRLDSRRGLLQSKIWQDLWLRHHPLYLYQLCIEHS